MASFKHLNCVNLFIWLWGSNHIPSFWFSSFNKMRIEKKSEESLVTSYIYHNTTKAVFALVFLRGKTEALFA